MNQRERERAGVNPVSFFIKVKRLVFMILKVLNPATQPETEAMSPVRTAIAGWKKKGVKRTIKKYGIVKVESIRQV